MALKGSILLRLFGVTKIFPGVRALDDVSFDVLAGEVHGLVGENGAGKSTLMAVASGALVPEEGQVLIDGHQVVGDPGRARALGLAIVRQEPALMPDLTVAENLLLGLPTEKRPPVRNLEGWCRAQLRLWSDEVSFGPHDKIAMLNPEQRFIVEIVKALANEPKVLVLDEPTEHLPSDDVERLFDRVREITAKDCSVVYISHRIREVQQIADRITVLRDGKGQGTYQAQGLSEDEIVSLIVGRDLDREFPAKTSSGGGMLLDVRKLSGVGFSDVSLTLRAGEILGLAGIDGNGQREFMRALAGVTGSNGDVVLEGVPARLSSVGQAVQAGISYLPGDRHREGIMPAMSILENFSLRSKDSTGSWFINRGDERRRAVEAFSQLRVKAPTPETPIGSLSGGNQQKVVLASVLASRPKVLLVDEPTQGVDVGARMEIYRIIREAASAGMAVIIVSSDAGEIAGLSDRVAIFSRGQVVDTLTDEEVTEGGILAAVLKSTSVRQKGIRNVNGFVRWAAGDAAPLLMLLAAIVALGAVAGLLNPFYLSPRSLSGMMILVATLAIVAYGQQAVMLIGGVDLSVGPLMGLSSVVASFYLVADAGGTMQTAGWFAILGVALIVGICNWVLVDPMGLHPMVGTLATFMALQAVSLLLRPVPAGMIDGNIMLALGSKWGIIPVSFIAAIILGVLLDLVLFRNRVGIAWRGFGSRPEAARVAGVSPRIVRFGTYVGCSLLTALAAITMLQQVGIGDPRAGIGYTLSSVAAVVVGGASLAGGRGSFVGGLLGAIFITQANAVAAFLNLDVAWQNYLLGGMIIAAVTVYSKSREMVATA